MKKSKNGIATRSAITLQQAAEILGVSRRTVQRYASKGKLACTNGRDANGRRATFFKRSELNDLKRELEALGTQAITIRQPIAKKADLKKPDEVSPTVASLKFAPEVIGASLAIIEAVKQLHPVRLTEKMTLDMREAAEFTGLSVGFLRKAIKLKELSPIKGCRGYRIVRAALVDFALRLQWPNDASS